MNIFPILLILALIGALERAIQFHDAPRNSNLASFYILLPEVF